MYSTKACNKERFGEARRERRATTDFYTLSELRRELQLASSTHQRDSSQVRWQHLPTGPEGRLGQDSQKYSDTFGVLYSLALAYTDKQRPQVVGTRSG